MLVRPLKSFDLDSVVDVGHALQLIETNLDDLISMSDTQIVGSDRKTMNDNITFIKCYYEKAESMLLKLKGTK